jgi:hypothetical protein
MHKFTVILRTVVFKQFVRKLHSSKKISRFCKLISEVVKPDNELITWNKISLEKVSSSASKETPHTLWNLQVN